MRNPVSCTSVAVVLLALSASAAFGQATIEVESIVDDEPFFDVTLSTGGADVAGTENVIEFGPEVQVSACEVNPNIDRGASAFSFSPSGCTPGTDCESVKALILSFTSLDPLADGVVLYRCGVVIAGGTAAGDYDLTCTNPGGSDPDGNSVDTGCASGSVTVHDTAVANLSIGSTTIEPGGAGSIDITLDLLDTTAQVAATENVISFAPETQIARCQVNPDIDRGASAFALSPAGCAPGVDCESIKALVLSFTNLDPLADGTLLYTCDVVSVPAGSASGTVSGLSSGTSEGTFALTCSEAGSSDPGGNALTTDCSDGEVQVIAPTPEPTPTPTIDGVAGADLVDDISADATELTLNNVSGMIPPDGIMQIGDERITYSGLTDNGDGSFTLTGLGRGAQGTQAVDHAAGERVEILESSVTPTATATATATVEDTATNTPGGFVPDDDSCAVVAPQTSSTGWMLLLPIAGLVWLRRKQ